MGALDDARKWFAENKLRAVGEQWRWHGMRSWHLNRYP